MKKNKPTSEELSMLRKRAEQELNKRQEHNLEQSTETSKDIIHELEVHQIELEMQNEELRRAQVELEDSRQQYTDLYDFAPVGYFVFDKNGLIINVNLTGASMLGIERANLISKPFHLYICDEHQDTFYSHRRQIFYEGKDASCEINFTRKDGTLTSVQMQSQPVKDPQGSVIRCRSAILDITKRKYAEKQRRHFVAKLQAKDEELERFTSFIRHDFGNSILSIQAYSEVIAQETRQICRLLEGQEIGQDVKIKLFSILNENMPSAVEYLKQSSSHMIKLLEGLRQINAVGHLSVNIEPLDINKIVKEIIGAMRFQVEKCGVSVNVDPLPYCLGDSTQIKQVVNNLLSNAVKYLDPDRKGQIHIWGRTDQEWSIYCVEDNGIGIDPDKQKLIFDAFYRIYSDDQIPGEGLGLSLVTRIIERLNGRAWVESEPAKGSAFYIELPTATIPRSI